MHRKTTWMKSRQSSCCHHAQPTSLTAQVSVSLLHMKFSAATSAAVDYTVQSPVTPTVKKAIRAWKTSSRIRQLASLTA